MSQWPRGLRRWSAAAHLLRLQVRMPPGAWMSVCCECCVLSGKGLCVGRITRTYSNYRTRLVSITILNIPLAFTDNYFGHICHFRHKSTFPVKITTLGSKLKYRASSEPYTLKSLWMNLTMEFNASSDSDQCV